MVDDLSSSPARFDHLARTRTTVRSLLSEPVSRSLLLEILDVARTAPRTFNTQPWHVHLLAGKAKDDLAHQILVAHEAATLPAFSPFPAPLPKRRLHTKRTSAADITAAPRPIEQTWKLVTVRPDDTSPSSALLWGSSSQLIGDSPNTAGWIAAYSCKRSCWPPTLAGSRHVHKSRFCVTNRSSRRNWASPTAKGSPAGCRSAGRTRKQPSIIWRCRARA